MSVQALKEEDVRNIIEDYPRGRVKEVSDADYTIGDHDDYDLFLFTSLTADRTLTFPSLSSHSGKRFKVINGDGSYDVICDPGTDKINTYAATVEITEKWGWWEFIGGTDQWVGITDGKSTVYETVLGSQFNQTSAATNTYYDIGLNITLDPGIYDIHYRGNVAVNETSDSVSEASAYYGIDTRSGDLVGGLLNVDWLYWGYILLYDYLRFRDGSFRNIFEYTVATQTTFYTKVRGPSEENPLAALTVYYYADSPIYIRAYRKA